VHANADAGASGLRIPDPAHLEAGTGLGIVVIPPKGRLDRPDRHTAGGSHLLDEFRVDTGVHLHRDPTAGALTGNALRFDHLGGDSAPPLMGAVNAPLHVARNPPALGIDPDFATERILSLGTEETDPAEIDLDDLFHGEVVGRRDGSPPPDPASAVEAEYLASRHADRVSFGIVRLPVFEGDALDYDLAAILRQLDDLPARSLALVE